MLVAGRGNQHKSKVWSVGFGLRGGDAAGGQVAGEGLLGLGMGINLNSFSTQGLCSPLWVFANPWVLLPGILFKCWALFCIVSSFNLSPPPPSSDGLSSDRSLLTQSPEFLLGIPGGPVVKNPPADAAYVGSIPAPGRSRKPQNN